MILEETIQKLVEMKLSVMAQTLREMLSSPPTEPLSTDEVIGMLIDREWSARENKRLDRLLKDARVPNGVSLEELSCEAGRGVERSFARTLGACQWVRANRT